MRSGVKRYTLTGKGSLWIAGFCCILLFLSFSQAPITLAPDYEKPFVIVLGTTQDAGSPQAGCSGTCCSALFERPDPERKVSCLGLVDQEAGKTYLFEAGPDFKQQVYLLQKECKVKSPGSLPDGIFVSHAHIGHYTGLMQLGREAVNSHNIPVYVLPGMKNFLENNAPYSQLCRLQNIRLQTLRRDSILQLGQGLSVQVLQVPHRDEFSETAAYIIRGRKQKVLFIPDIDKWEKWDKDILKIIHEVDCAFIDGTFYTQDELPGRNLKEIPHPTVKESAALFASLSASDKAKIHFIHFNHSNPLLNANSEACRDLKYLGFNRATYLQKIILD
ncbi:MAG TPA: MBL fold metallo-hydrolase [Bacteroidia bacterium]|nr:MBL fold metallo-hydrolase [Bacteroidia bacterium]